MRRISQQELDALRSDLEERARIAREGGGEDPLAIAYLIAEIDHLERTIWQIVPVMATRLVARPHLAQVLETPWPPVGIQR